MSAENQAVIAGSVHAGQTTVSASPRRTSLYRRYVKRPLDVFLVLLGSPIVVPVVSAVSQIIIHHTDSTGRISLARLARMRSWSRNRWRRLDFELIIVILFIVAMPDRTNVVDEDPRSVVQPRHG